MTRPTTATSRSPGRSILTRGTEFTLGLAFGDSRHRAITTLFQSLVTPFDASLQAILRGVGAHLAAFFAGGRAPDRRSQVFYERSVNLLLAHEDKSYPGAMIAALSIPWGSSKGDEELGGYHLVWTRDLVQSATALLAAGDLATPLRVLVYLAVSQRDDGGFFQNFWIDGRPYWSGVQLDEVSFPLVLAWRLHQADALGGFNPCAMAAAACGFLMREGPVTPQDRWEEAAGFSPSTLAVNIAGLICAAELLAADGDTRDRRLRPRVRRFSGVARRGVDGHDRGHAAPRGRAALHPRQPERRRSGGSECGHADPDQPGAGRPLRRIPAKEIVDAGFLELVRYGVRDAHDPIIVDSLRVVDAVLKVDLPQGPAWRRYNHDGYGQRADGSSFKGWGVGRPWPLLTGERGALRAGGRPGCAPVSPRAAGVRRRYRADLRAGLGRARDSRKASRSRRADRSGDSAGVGARGVHQAGALRRRRPRVRHDRAGARALQQSRADAPSRRWRSGARNGRCRRFARARDFACIAGAPFTLRWSSNDWQDQHEAAGKATRLGVWFVDIPPVTSTLRLKLSFADGLAIDANVGVSVVTRSVSGLQADPIRSG